jgi:hypothetical protein
LCCPTGVVPSRAFFLFCAKINRLIIKYLTKHPKII